MATTAFWYGKGLMHVMSDINVLTDTLKLALTTNSYSPNQDTDETFANVTNEVVGTGYVAGGATITGVSMIYTAGTNTAAIKFTSPSWAASAITARRAVLYKSTGNPSTSLLIGWQDAGADQTSSGGVFQFTVAAGGFVSASAA